MWSTNAYMLCVIAPWIEFLWTKYHMKSPLLVSFLDCKCVCHRIVVLHRVCNIQFRTDYCSHHPCFVKKILHLRDDVLMNCWSARRDTTHQVPFSSMRLKGCVPVAKDPAKQESCTAWKILYCRKLQVCVRYGIQSLTLPNVHEHSRRSHQGYCMFYVPVARDHWH